MSEMRKRQLSKYSRYFHHCNINCPPFHNSLRYEGENRLTLRLQSGADPSVFNAKGEKPEAMTTSPDILKLLGAEVTISVRRRVSERVEDGRRPPLKRL
jgi:hypothetical protein